MTNAEKFNEVQAHAKTLNLSISRFGGKIIIQTHSQQVEVDDLFCATLYLAGYGAGREVANSKEPTL